MEKINYTLKMKKIIYAVNFIAVLVLLMQTAKAEVRLNNLFSNHMVLQRNIENPVWGTANKGEKVTVSIAGQNHSTQADKDGKWKIKLNPMEAGGPHTMIVNAKNKIEITDILVGEVWICSGQSNMGFSLKGIYNAEVEIAAANYPHIRLLSPPRVAGPEPQSDIDATWVLCSPEFVEDFSAVGYLFGKNIHNALGVPIGLINATWGGTPIEAFVPRSAMDTVDVFRGSLKKSDKSVEAISEEQIKTERKEYDAWVKAGNTGTPDKNSWPALKEINNKNRPGNIYNTMIHPLVGYGIKGVIWYQGEANANRNPQLYSGMFPCLINSWRTLWKQGDFPFYWVQLANYKERKDQPEEATAWVTVREAQTKTLSLTNTGQAVTIDAGEGRDVHYRDKQTVAYRLARHALANDYGFKMVAASPLYKSMEVKGNKIEITFANIDKGLYAFEVEEVKGFAIAGKDGKFVWAKANIVAKNKVEVYADTISEPVSVRYGWADNPVVNLYDYNGLPVTPFRTDK